MIKMVEYNAESLSAQAGSSRVKDNLGIGQRFTPKFVYLWVIYLHDKSIF